MSNLKFGTARYLLWALILTLLPVSFASSASAAPLMEAPVLTSIITGNGTLKVGFIPDGSGSATDYEYSLDAGGNWQPFGLGLTTSPLLITGLTNGSTYDVAIRSFDGISTYSAASNIFSTVKLPLLGMFGESNADVITDIELGPD